MKTRIFLFFILGVFILLEYTFCPVYAIDTGFTGTSEISGPNDLNMIPSITYPDGKTAITKPTMSYKITPHSPIVTRLDVQSNEEKFIDVKRVQNDSISVTSAGDTTLVSVSSSEKQGNKMSYESAISSDGRYIAFSSDSTNLVTGDTNGKKDIFVRDCTKGTTTCVSRATSGTQGNGDSSTLDSPSISSDGRYVVFTSDATNLITSDTNGVSDIFIHDRTKGTTQCISRSASGVQGNGASYNPSISSNGRYIVFESSASNLILTDSDVGTDIFVHDTTNGVIYLASINSNGEKGNIYSINPGISADGRYVAFSSDSTNLVTGDTNGKRDIFVRDRTTGTTTCVSRATSGTQGNGDSSTLDSPSISSDGRYVVFTSDATNLVTGDTNGKIDVFVHDRTKGTTTRVSRTTSGTQGKGDSYSPSISSDGRYVAFFTESTLVTGDTNRVADVFIHDRNTGTTVRGSVSSSGSQSNGGASSYPALSSDGKFVAFTSYANNLVSGDVNKVTDVFVHKTDVSPAPTVISITPNTAFNSNTVTITKLSGTNFVSKAKVYLTRAGNGNIVATNVVVVSPTKITCKLPITGKQTGQWNVVVKNPNGKSGKKVNAFRISSLSDIVVTSITPATGLNSGPVTITNLVGKNFKQKAKVYLTKSGYSNIPATNVMVKSKNKITCKLPITGKQPGKWNVVVKNPDGKTGTKENGFTITAPAPIVTSITPATGLNTGPVTITNLAGKNFQSKATVYLTRAGYSNIPATNVVVNSQNKITCKLPIAGKQSGKWNVVVKNPDGKTGTKTNAFTIKSNPVWTQMTSGAGWSPRMSHKSVTLPDDSIVLIGGLQGNGPFWNDVWRSTDKGKTWTQMTSNAGYSPLASQSCVALADGSIVVMGGNIVGDWTYSNDVWRSADKGKTWNKMTSSAGWSARCSHTSVALPDGSIVLMGGNAGYDGSSYKNDVWRSTDKGETWTQMTSSAGWSPRVGLSSVALSDGSIVVMGGEDSNSKKYDVWRSTDKGKTWVEMNSNSPVRGNCIVSLTDGSIVLVGGYDVTYKNYVWKSEDKGKTWVEMLSDAPWSVRGSYSTVALSDGSIVLMGGHDGNNYYNDVWRLASGST